MNLNRTQSITLLSLTALTLVAAGGPAIAKRGDNRSCSSASQAQWKPIAEVEAAVAGQGYEIVKSERKSGCYEFHARKDGSRFEIYADPATGEIVRKETR